MSHHQSTAIITGASRGIGYAAAALFLQHNWRVINLSRKTCDLQGVTNIHTDFNAFDPDAVQAQLKAHLSQSTQMCVVHNASWYQHDSVDALPLQNIVDSLTVGVTVPSQLTQYCLPYMATGSSIIYMGSTLSEKAVKHAASYIVNKHAVVGLMRATCQDLDNRGIHTACICPGFTDTEMLRSHIGTDPTVQQQLTQTVSARRFATPEEMAQTIWFCANNAVINGSVIHANLGQIAR